MATHIPVDERFTKYTGKYNGKSNPSMRRAPLDQTIHNSSQMLERQQDSRCVKYVGTIGGDWPTVQVIQLSTTVANTSNVCIDCDFSVAIGFQIAEMLKAFVQKFRMPVPRTMKRYLLFSIYGRKF